MSALLGDERVRRCASEAFVALVVALQAGALAPWFASGRGVGDGLVQQAAFGAVYLVALVLLTVRFARRRRVRGSWWMLWPLAYLSLAAASVLWSDVPELTARRVAALVGTLVFAYFVAESMDARRALRGVAIGLLVIAAASYAMLVLTPDLAIHASGRHAGNWRGALLHKNLLGREMALATTLMLALAVVAPLRQRRVWLAVAVATALLVVGARSATGLVLLASGAAAVTLAALPAINARERLGRRVIVVTAIAAAVVLVVAAGGLVLDALGRDATFTGRDRLWEVTVAELEDRYWTGAGYMAFWEGPGGEAVSARLGYDVGHAHNGLLQAATSLGVPGVVLMLLLYLGALVRVVRAPAMRAARPLGVGLMVHFGMLSITDAVMTGPNSVSLSIAVALLLMRPRASEAAGAEAPEPLAASPSRTRHAVEVRA